MIYHIFYWLILYQIDFCKFLSDCYFMRTIIGKFGSIDILSNKKCWKIFEKVDFLIILLGLKHTLGMGVLKFPYYSILKRQIPRFPSNSYQMIIYQIDYWKILIRLIFHQIDFLQILINWYFYRSKMLEYRQNGCLNDITACP